MFDNFNRQDSYSEGYSTEDYILKDECLLLSKKHIVSLFKNFLFVIEQLKSESDININKLIKTIPAEYTPLLTMSNSLDDERFQRLRKVILDIGNQTSRDLERDLNNL